MDSVMTSSGAPLTAADIVDAKLDQVQSRLAYLWSISHSPIALHAPLLAASYMRQLRLVAFHQDVSLATPQTQLTYCNQCSQVHIPGVNATVTVEASREKKRRQRRALRRAASKKGAEEDSASKDSSRKRKRSASPTGTPRKEAPGSFSGAQVAQPPSQEISVRCLTCRHRDFAPGMTRKNRALLQASSTELEQLVAGEVARIAEPEEELHHQQAEKAKSLRAALQSQTSVAAPKAPAFDLLSQARMALAGGHAAVNPIATLGTGVAAAPLGSSTSTPSKPFSFTAGRSSAPAVAAASSAPFSFSRSAPAAKPAAAVPFSHSAKKAKAEPPPTGNFMQGIQIIGGMKSAPAKTAAKPPAKNNNKKW